MSTPTTCALCGEAAVLKCSACKLVSYCNKEHQKSHWKDHKSLCNGYEVHDSPTIGKHLIATRDLNPGDTIICEPPLLIGPKIHADFTSETISCVGCYRTISLNNPPGRCLGCGWPSCATHCPGLNDAHGHATECQILKLRNAFAINMMEDFYRFYALMPLRCLLLQKRDPKKWRKLLEMESHKEKRGRGTDIYEVINENIVKYLYDNYLQPLKLMEEKTGTKVLNECSTNLIHQMCGILDVNSLEIRLNNGAEVTALYPTAYLLEHSCVPNTRHIFEIDNDLSKQHQTKIVVKASVPIKKGQHITTMYTHALWGTQARRDHLRDTKYFSCECVRCKDPTELSSYISGLKCMGSPDGSAPCGGTQLPVNPLDDNTEWSCDKCVVKLANAEVMFLVNQIAEEVDAVQTENPCVKSLEALLEKLSAFFHPHHYHMYSTKHSLIQLYGYQQGYLPNQLTNEILQRKITMCRELIDITDKIDPGSSRLSLYQAVSLHELHLAQIQKIKKIWTECFEREPYREQIRECRKLLDKAIEILSYENDGSAGYKLRELITTSKKDLEKWIDQMRVAV